MEWDVYLLVIITQILVGGSAAFFGAYLKERATGLAKSKDLKGLTQIVEEVKRSLERDFYAYTLKTQRMFDALAEVNKKLGVIRRLTEDLINYDSNRTPETMREDIEQEALKALQELRELADDHELDIPEDIYSELTLLCDKIAGFQAAIEKAIQVSDGLRHQAKDVVTTKARALKEEASKAREALLQYYKAIGSLKSGDTTT